MQNQFKDFNEMINLITTWLSVKICQFLRLTAKLSGHFTAIS